MVQAVVVVQLLARGDVAQRLDEDAAVVVSSASQFGSQAWLIQREALPPYSASITWPVRSWK
jgi:hypothetical protein